MDQRIKILAIDDDLSTLKLIKFSLEQDDFIVFTASDGKEALEIANLEKPHLAIIDLRLPKMSGFEVCHYLRNEFKDNIAIIILTSDEEKPSKIFGFKLGADDYITKPFDIDELSARVSAVLRRTIQLANKNDNLVTIDNLTIDLDHQLVYKNNEQLDLTVKEFELLALLLKNRGKICTREYILNTVWGYSYYGDTRTIDAHIQRLRRKIEDDCDDPQFIITHWGKGYKLK